MYMKWGWITSPGSVDDKQLVVIIAPFEYGLISEELMQYIGFRLCICRLSLGLFFFSPTFFHSISVFCKSSEV